MPTVSSRNTSRAILAASIASLLSLPAIGADIFMMANDALDTTSFNTGIQWQDGAAPVFENNYFTSNFQLRTPTGTSDNTFGGGSLTIQAGGSMLFKGSGVMTINDLRLDGGGIFQGLTTSNEAKLAGTVNVLSSSTFDTTVDINRIITVSSYITGSGNLSLLGSSGTIRFTNAFNDWSGAATIGNGANTVLEIASIADGGLMSSLGASSNAASNIVLNTGTLRVTGSIGGTTDRLFTLAGNGAIESNASAAVNFTNTGNIAFSGAGDRTFTLGGTSTAANTFAPQITDNPNGGVTTFTKAGTGTWTVSGTNTYTGATNINAGVLVFSNLNNLGAGTAINFGGGTLRWETGNTVDITSRTVTATSGTSNFDTNGQEITLAGTLAGAGEFRKTGAGRLILSGNNTFSGRFIVNNGAVLVTNSNALGTGAGAIKIDGDVGASGVLELSGNVNIAKPFIVSARQAGTIDAPHILNVSGNNTISGQVNLDVGGSDYNFESASGFLLLSGGINTSSVTSGTRRIKLGGAGDGQINGIVNPSGAALNLPLVKNGAGTWTIAGPSSYSGTTTVNQGTLITNTAATGSGAVTVADGAGFGVRVFAAGQSYVTPSLTIGTSTGGTLTFDLGALGNSTAPVVVASTFAPTGSVGINVAGSNLSVGQFKLVDYTQIGGSGFASLSLGVLPPRVAATLVDNTVETSVDLKITAFDFPRWNGNVSGDWDTSDSLTTGPGTANWKEVNSGNATKFLQGTGGIDSVLFDDNATGTTTVNLTTTLTPTSVLVNNNTLQYTFTGAGKLSGSTGLTKQGTGTLIIANTGVNDFTGNAVIDAGTLQLGDGTTAGAGTLGSVNIRIASGGTLALNRPDDFTFTNVVSGAGTVKKQGSGTVTVIGNNTAFDGAFNVSAGTIKLGSANALGNASGTASFSSGSTLDLNGFVLPAGKMVTVAGAGVDGNGAIVNSTASATTPGLKKLTFTGDTTFGGTQRWDIRDSVNGLNAAGFKLTKTGPNEIFLKDLAETGLGNVEILSGTLGFEGSTSMGSNLGTVTVRQGARLALFNNTSFNNKAVSIDGGTVVVGGGTANTLNGAVTLTGSTIADVTSGAALTLAGLVDGTGSLTKNSAGTLTLSGNSSFTGGLNITAGTVNITGTTNYSGGTTIATGTTVNVGGGGSTGSLGAGDVVNNGTLNINRLGTDLVLANNISGAGAFNIGAGNAANFDAVVTLSGNNTFTGNVNVNGGGLRITNSNALGSGPKTIILTNGTNGHPGLRLAAGNEPIVLGPEFSFNTSNVNGDGAIVNERGDNTIQGNFKMTLGGGDTAITVLDGTLRLTGTFTADTTNRHLILRGSGDGFFDGSLADGTGGNIPGLQKDGTGTWSINGANSYTGSTVINDGTLLVNGSISGSWVTVNSGATLGGAGSISNGDISLYMGSRLAPGNGLGTMTLDLFSGLDLSMATDAKASGALLFELGSVAASDKITLTTGSFNIGSGVLEFDDFDFSTLAGYGAGTYTLLDSNNSIFGTLGTNVSGIVGGLPATLAFADGGNDLVLNVIPEPTSATLVVAGLGSLLGCRRFRRKSSMAL